MAKFILAVQKVAHKKRGKDARIGSASAVLRTFGRPFWRVIHTLTHNPFAAFDLLFIRLLRIIQLGVAWLARSRSWGSSWRDLKTIVPRHGHERNSSLPRPRTLSHLLRYIARPLRMLTGLNITRRFSLNQKMTSSRRNARLKSKKTFNECDVNGGGVYFHQQW